ncbi:MAG: hypothetical protein U9Q08_01885 [Candidatus Omnitrophota bacterium]|nr:hypothetical protein [Candidatus Omnitrophota bacterium]
MRKLTVLIIVFLGVSLCPPALFSYDGTVRRSPLSSGIMPLSSEDSPIEKAWKFLLKKPKSAVKQSLPAITPEEQLYGPGGEPFVTTPEEQLYGPGGEPFVTTPGERLYGPGGELRYLLPGTIIALPDGRSIEIKEDGSWRIDEANGSYWNLELDGYVMESVMRETGGWSYAYDALGTYVHQRTGMTEDFRYDDFDSYLGEVDRIENFISNMLVDCEDEHVREQLQESLAVFKNEMPREPAATYYYNAENKLVARVTENGDIQFPQEKGAKIYDYPSPDSFFVNEDILYIDKYEEKYGGALVQTEYSYNTTDGINGILHPGDSEEGLELAGRLHDIQLYMNDFMKVAEGNTELLSMVQGYCQRAIDLLKQGGMEFEEHSAPGRNYYRFTMANNDRVQYLQYSTMPYSVEYIISEKTEPDGKRTVFHNYSPGIEYKMSQIACTVYDTDGLTKEYLSDNMNFGVAHVFSSDGYERIYRKEGDYYHLEVKKDDTSVRYRQHTDDVGKPMTLWYGIEDMKVITKKNRRTFVTTVEDGKFAVEGNRLWLKHNYVLNLQTNSISYTIKMGQRNIRKITVNPGDKQYSAVLQNMVKTLKMQIKIETAPLKQQQLRTAVDYLADIPKF